jgi:hypothetical protein
MRCEIFGKSELSQGGEEAGLIHGGNNYLGFTIYGEFFFTIIMTIRE